jgi:hypothetical protein
MKNLCALAFLLLVGTSALAAQTETNWDPPSSLIDGFRSHWSLEGSLQAHSVAGAASPWLGIAGEYRLLNPVSLGLRGFLPVAKTVDNSTYSVQGFARARMLQGNYTDFFFEPEYSANFYNFVPFYSYGAALGTLTRVLPGLSVGVLGGIELAHEVIDSVGLEERGDLIVYPKISFLANFNF